MPPGQEVAGLTLEAKTAAFVADIRRAGVQGEDSLKALSSQYLRTLRASESASKGQVKAARDAAKANQQLAGATANAADSANRAAKALGPLGGILARVSPEAGAAASSIAAMTSAAEGFQAAGLVGSFTSLLPVLIPVGIAVGGLALAYEHYSSAAEEAEQRQAAARVEAERSIQVFTDLKTAVAKLDQEWAVATDQLSDVAAQAQNAQERVRALYEKPLAAQAETIRQTQSLVAERQRNFEALSREEGGSDRAAAATQGLIKALDRQQAVYDGLIATRDEALTKADEVVASDVLEGRAKREVAAATAAATRSLAEWNDEIARAEALNKANRQVYDGVIASMAELEAADQRSLKTTSERMEADHKAAIAQLDDLRKQARKVAETTAARETIDQEYRAASLAESEAYYTALGEYDDGLAAKRAENAAAAAAAEEEYRRRSRDAAIAIIGEISSISASASDVYARNAESLRNTLETQGDQLTDAERRDLEERIAAQEQAALVAFRVSQVSAMAEAAINTALAASEAATGAPWPYNLVLVAGAIALGVSQEVAIASQAPPTFGDTPGAMKMEQGGTVRLAAGDFFAAAQTPDDLRRQVAPEQSAPSVSYLVLDHKVIGQAMGRQLQRGPLAAAVRAGRKVGHSDRWRR